MNIDTALELTHQRLETAKAFNKNDRAGRLQTMLDELEAAQADGEEKTVKALKKYADALEDWQAEAIGHVLHECDRDAHNRETTALKTEITERDGVIKYLKNELKTTTNNTPASGATGNDGAGADAEKIKDETTKQQAGAGTAGATGRRGRPHATKYVVTQAQVAELSGKSIDTVARYDKAFEEGKPIGDYPGRGNEAAIHKWCINHKAHIAEKTEKRRKATFDPTRPGADGETEYFDAIRRKPNGDIEIDPEAGISVHKTPGGLI